MRESLTVLAVVIISVLAAALVGPYFVDWTAQRAVIEARLSEALGEPVRIQGAIDLKLLPTPYLALDKVEVADDGAPLRFKADSLRLEIAVAPLLRGEIDFIEARFVRPRISVALNPDGSLPPMQIGAALPVQSRFERISVADGSLRIDDVATGRHIVVEPLDLAAEASSLVGPFKGEGTAGRGKDRTAFRFSTAAREGDRLRGKLVVDATASHPRLDADGALVWAGRGLLSFIGSGIVSGQMHVAETTLRWRAAGGLRADARKISSDMLEWRIGDEDRGLAATGPADIDLGGTPKASVTLRAKQVDLDRAFAAENGPPAFARLVAAVRETLADPKNVTAPLAANIEWSAEQILLGGETLSGLGGAVGLAADHTIWLRFDGALPGRARLLLDGTIEAGPAAVYNGRVEAASADLPRLADWLAPAFGDSSALPSTMPAMPFRSVDVAGTVSVSAAALSAREASIKLDRSQFSGAVTYTAPLAGERARLFADLTSPALDLDGVPDFRGLASGAAGMDLALRLGARATRLARVGQGMIEAGRIRLRLDKSGDDVRVDEFAVENLGGATINGSATWTGQNAHVDAKLDANRLQDMAELLRRLAPGTASAAFATRAATLSPARLDLVADFTQASDTLRPTRLTLSGTAGTTRLAAEAGPGGAGADDMALSASLDSGDASQLLRQLGVASLPLPGLGSGHIAVKAHGPWLGAAARPLETDFEAAFAGTSLRFRGTTQSDASRFSGAVTASSADMAPLLRATGLAFPDLTARLPLSMTGTAGWESGKLALRDLKGSVVGTAMTGALAIDPAAATPLDGKLGLDRLPLDEIVALLLGLPQPAKAGVLWSNLPFAATAIDLPKAHLSLAVRTLDLAPLASAREARFEIATAPGLMSLSDVALQVAGGRVAGAVTLRRDGGTAALDGKLRFDDLRLDTVGLRALASGTLDIAGTGRNALALVGGLAGEGQARLADVALPRSDPTALPRVFDAVEDDRLAVDETSIANALRREFDKAAFTAPARDYVLSLAAGVLRVETTPVAAASAPVAADFAASLDLRNLAVDERLTASLRQLPKNWTGPLPRVELTVRGSYDKPSFSLDAGNFVNALAARAIARESARIQAFEFDAHERAVNNQRLSSERRREQERLRAIELERQRVMEEARRAAEAERQRVDDERRRIAEAARQRKLEEDRRRADEERGRAEDAARAAAPTNINPVPNGAAAPASRFVDPSTAGRY